MNNKTKIFQIDNVQKSFVVGDQEVNVVKGISFEVIEGDFLVIFGPSGSGKSTLLHMILGLEVPSAGKVIMADKNLYDYDEDERSGFRKKLIGMVYQQPNWIKSLTVTENVSFPLLLLGEERDKALLKARELVKMVGMEHRADYLPTELSSGQQQKISLARALINDPKIIIADEPTGNLDTLSGKELMDLLKRLNQEGKTVMMVTHDLEYIRYASRVLHLLDGKVDKEYKDNINVDELKEISRQGKKGD